MLDVQSQKDSRHVRIRKVGVKGLRLPIVWGDQPTVGNLNLYVELAPEHKGTHMSRFNAIAYAHMNALSPSGLVQMGEDILAKLHAPRTFVELAFPWFYKKPAPVTGTTGVADCDVKISFQLDNAGRQESTLEITVPVQSLCPCSKAISQYGAHNQRSHLVISLYNDLARPISDIIQAAESAASCAVYPLLKREDEKFVTESAYENPKFVEDLVRDAALALKAIGLKEFEVTAENFESIHNHNVWAVVSSADLGN